MTLLFTFKYNIIIKCVLLVAICEASKSGKSFLDGADSCREIKEHFSQSLSGLYWIKKYDQSHTLTGVERQYCDMETERCGIKGGWTRVADLDMTQDSQTCPGNLEVTTSPSRMCRQPHTHAGCTTVIYRLHNMAYSRVCGRAIGYGCGGTDSIRHSTSQINDPYVDGISITHGVPRKHIWTFAADYSSRCPRAVPPSVGSDWFCETTGTLRCLKTQLWDGLNCVKSNDCSKSGQPWFCRTFPVATTDDIDVRICRDDVRSDEEVGLEQLELYDY